MESEAERDYSRKRVTKLTTPKETKKRKPLADLTNFENPSSVIPKPCNPNPNPLNPPRNSSNSSIGSSISSKNNPRFSSSLPGHGGVEGSKLLVTESEGKGVSLQCRYSQEERAGDTQRTLKSDSVTLYNPFMEKTNDRGKTRVNLQLNKTKDKGKATDAALKIDSAERTQDKGKAIAGHLDNHALLKTQDKGKGIAVSSDSISVESVKYKATESYSIQSLPSLPKTRDKGKAVVRFGDLSSVGKRKDRGNGVSSHFSCPPVPKTRRIRYELNEAGDDGHLRNKDTGSKIRARSAGKRRLPRDKDTPEYNLPADFIEKQRAYYKEVDEFELLEEEASDNEDETKGRGYSKSVI